LHNRPNLTAPAGLPWILRSRGLDAHEPAERAGVAVTGVVTERDLRVAAQTAQLFAGAPQGREVRAGDSATFRHALDGHRASGAVHLPRDETLAGLVDDGGRHRHLARPGGCEVGGAYDGAETERVADLRRRRHLAHVDVRRR